MEGSLYNCQGSCGKSQENGARPNLVVTAVRPVVYETRVGSEVKFAKGTEIVSTAKVCDPCVVKVDAPAIVIEEPKVVVHTLPKPKFMAAAKRG